MDIGGCWMKKPVCLVILGSLLSFVLSGCNKPEFTRMDFKALPEAVQGFYQNNRGKNGVFIYASPADKLDGYLLFDTSLVLPDEKKLTITNVSFKTENNNLKISYTTALADRVTSTEQDHFYVISENHDSITLYKDGAETPFDRIGT
jgi:hypothetical protein